MEEATYNVQCILGDHVFGVKPGTELEQKCIEHEQSGKLDALVLGPDDCPGCVEKANKADLTLADMCFDLGCAFAYSDSQPEACRNGACVGQAAVNDRSNPWADQVIDCQEESMLTPVSGVTVDGRPLYQEDAHLWCD